MGEPKQRLKSSRKGPPKAGTALRPRAAGCEIPGVLQRFICARKPLKEAVQSRACISNPDLPES